MHTHMSALVLVAVVSLLGFPYTAHVAQSPVPDCSDGTWNFVKQEVNVLDGVPWSLGRMYTKRAPDKVLGCLTISLLWDFEYPVYQTWGTFKDHVQSLRKGQTWTPSVKGSKMEHVLRVDDKNTVLSAVLMLYDGDAEHPAIWETYRNPSAGSVSPETEFAPVWH